MFNLQEKLFSQEHPKQKEEIYDGNDEEEELVNYIHINKKKE